jgi:hypothetical protein
MNNVTLRCASGTFVETFYPPCVIFHTGRHLYVVSRYQIMIIKNDLSCELYAYNYCVCISEGL